METSILVLNVVTCFAMWQWHEGRNSVWVKKVSLSEVQSDNEENVESRKCSEMHSKMTSEPSL